MRTRLLCWMFVYLSIVVALGADLKEVEKCARECQAGKEKSCQKLTQIALKNKNWEIRRAAVQKLNDPATLALIAKTDWEYYVFVAALEKIGDPVILAEIYQSQKDWGKRRAVIGKLTDQGILTQIAKTDSEEILRKTALSQITDPELLMDIAKTANDVNIRKSALKKVGLSHIRQIQLTVESKWCADELSKIVAYNMVGIPVSVGFPSPDENTLALRLSIEGEPIAALYLNKGINIGRRYTGAQATAHLLLEDFGIEYTGDSKIEPGTISGYNSDGYKYPADAPVCAAAKKAAEDAIQVLNSFDITYHIPEQTFVEIALHDQDLWLRAAAVRRLTNQQILSEIAQSDQESLVRRAAVERLTDPAILSIKAQADSDLVVRRIAVENDHFTDQSVLVKIVRTDFVRDVRQAAMNKLTDPLLLAEVARTAKDEGMRERAVGRIMDQAVLAEIAQKAKDLIVRTLAVKKLTDKVLLVEIADSAAEANTVREAAQERLKQLK